jgi:contactin associated protein-like 2
MLNYKMCIPGKNMSFDGNWQGIFTLHQLYNLLISGASVEDRNGYVGCMRGLRINGVLQDLRGLVHREEVTYGVSEGCVGKCANQMCFNGGTCIEGYSGYTCDCAYTPFRGWNCGRGKGNCNQRGNVVCFDEMSFT